MPFDERRVRALIEEMLDENPVAVRALLRVIRVEFTEQVQTLAVTLESTPRLLINPTFVREHCIRDEDVKAVLLHEFLHVVLGHTCRFHQMTPIQNLALDAVINAIIHRTMGGDYGQFFYRYYENQRGLARLLRPPMGDRACIRDLKGWASVPRFNKLWDALYAGQLVSDDILGLAQDLTPELAERIVWPVLIGNHDGVGVPLPTELADAVEEALREMNGHGIWRDPSAQGVGTPLPTAVVDQRAQACARWHRRVHEVLVRHVTPDPRSRVQDPHDAEYRLPVLSSRDRRAFLRADWSPLLPEATWSGVRASPRGSTQIYLDVSGSMNAEMPAIVGLLNDLRRYLRMPFWAFSNEVSPARIVGGKLVTATTGGTSMACVLRHLARTRPGAAVVVTDGYIEQVDPALVQAVRGVRIHALVTRAGTTAALDRAGIPCTQLEAYPR